MSMAIQNSVVGVLWRTPNVVLCAGLDRVHMARCAMSPGESRWTTFAARCLFLDRSPTTHPVYIRALFPAAVRQLDPADARILDDDFVALTGKPMGKSGRIPRDCLQMVHRAEECMRTVQATSMRMERILFRRFVLGASAEVLDRLVDRTFGKWRRFLQSTHAALYDRLVMAEAIATLPPVRKLIVREMSRPRRRGEQEKRKQFAPKKIPSLVLPRSDRLARFYHSQGKQYAPDSLASRYPQERAGLLLQSPLAYHLLEDRPACPADVAALDRLLQERYATRMAREDWCLELAALPWKKLRSVFL